MAYRDQRQVKLDVARVAELNKAARVNLEKRIARVLRISPDLHYYQGFHEVALRCDSASQLETLSLQHLRDFMASSMDPTLSICALVPEIISRADPELGHVIDSTPYFAVAPLLTLFSHGCDDPAIISAIIAQVLDQGLAIAVYMLAALCVVHRSRFVGLDDSDEVHGVLQKVGTLLTVENSPKVAEVARDLRSTHPLTKLRGYKRISRWSVLKTGPIPGRTQAIRALARLEKSLKRQTPHRVLRLAVAVSVLALGLVWSRKVTKP